MYKQRVSFCPCVGAFVCTYAAVGFGLLVLLLLGGYSHSAS